MKFLLSNQLHSIVNDVVADRIMGMNERDKDLMLRDLLLGEYYDPSGNIDVSTEDTVLSDLSDMFDSDKKRVEGYLSYKGLDEHAVTLILEEYFAESN